MADNTIYESNVSKLERRNMPLFIFFCGFMLFSSAKWIIRKFGPVTYEQILFHLNMPFDSETRLILSYLQNTVMTGAIIALLLWLLIFKKYKIRNKKIQKIRGFTYNYRWILCLLWLFFCVGYFVVQMNVWTMLTYRHHKREVSNFYEQNYVIPQQAEINFPSQKRNLILIFMESMESTFAKTPEHDYFNADLIEQLHTLAKDNINFSDNQYLGGSYQIDGTQWTQAGLMAQTCGIPIQLPIREVNLIHPKYKFYPNAWCLYDILQQQGYQESFLIGSNGDFAGLRLFVETHGQQKLSDTLYFAQKEKRKLSYKERSKSMLDKDLFVKAKKELRRLYTQKQPFVFTMMTLDTHFGSQGFAEGICEYKYGNEQNLENVVACASYQIGNFVKWLQNQPFYENTTVVLLGDHLMMRATFDANVQRHPLNIFINSAIKPLNEKNRIFTPFDIYPTIIESMGAVIAGHRLALGTSLFAETPTLTENLFSVEELNTEVRKSSKIYDWLLYGKQIE